MLAIPRFKRPLIFYFTLNFIKIWIIAVLMQIERKLSKYLNGTRTPWNFVKILSVLRKIVKPLIMFFEWLKLLFPTLYMFVFLSKYITQCPTSCPTKWYTSAWVLEFNFIIEITCVISNAIICSLIFIVINCYFPRFCFIENEENCLQVITFFIKHVISYPDWWISPQILNWNESFYFCLLTFFEINYLMILKLSYFIDTENSILNLTFVFLFLISICKFTKKYHTRTTSSSEWR